MILKFDPDELAAIKESQAQFQDLSVEADLKTTHNNYKVLFDAIEKLSNTLLSLVESQQILDQANTRHNSITGDINNDRVVIMFEILVLYHNFVIVLLQIR